MTALAVAQQPFTMSRMLVYCLRGCRAAFVLSLAIVFKEQRTRAATFISLNRPYDRVACTMDIHEDNAN